MPGQVSESKPHSKDGDGKGKNDYATREDGTSITLEKPDASSQPSTPDKIIEVNACGLACPRPLLKMKDGMDGINPGEVLHIKASEISEIF